MRQIVGSVEGEFRRYKALAEGALDQLTDEQLSRADGAGDNSVAILMAHISGNLVSRFTDFLSADGEKPWRDRDAEFVPRQADRAARREAWERAFAVLFDALAPLDDEQLHAAVTIRGVAYTVHEALHRALAHVSYHVGQIVFVAKALRGAGWRSLSIPPGGSAAYNQDPVREKPPSRP
jgi:uncharacterized damage-inducible protein DinB